MLSPNTEIQEFDSSFTIKNNSPARTYFSGFFGKGDINRTVQVDSVPELFEKLGAQNKDNTNDWFQAYNFLNYGSNLFIYRVCNSGDFNSTAEFPNNTLPKNVRIDNLEHLESSIGSIQMQSGNSIKFFAKNPGIWGNNIQLACINHQQYINNVHLYNNVFAHRLFDYIEEGQRGLVVFYNGIPQEVFIFNLIPGDPLYIENINAKSNFIYLKFRFIMYDGNIGYYDGLEYKIDGNITDHELNNLIVNYNDFDLSFFGNDILSLKNGTLTSPEIQDYENSLENFKNNIEDIDYIIGNEKVQKQICEIAEQRNNCIAFIGTPKELDTPAKILNYRMNTLGDFKCTALVAGYKYFTNPFNNEPTYCNLAGDFVGLRAKADINSRWIAAAGENSGSMINGRSNLVFSAQEQKMIYNKNINFFNISSLFGNKIMTSNPSALSRINVKNLSNFIFKKIEEAMRYFVFEQITEFEMQKIIAVIQMFLKEVQSDRGIQGYYCSVKIEDGTIILDVIYQPTYVAEAVQIRMINKGTSEILIGSASL